MDNIDKIDIVIASLLTGIVASQVAPCSRTNRLVTAGVVSGTVVVGLTAGPTVAAMALGSIVVTMVGYNFGWLVNTIKEDAREGAGDDVVEDIVDYDGGDVVDNDDNFNEDAEHND